MTCFQYKLWYQRKFTQLSKGLYEKSVYRDGKWIINVIFSYILPFPLTSITIAKLLSYVMLTESLLISSTLYNSSVWYNLNQTEIHELNKIDKFFFSRLFRISSTATFESFLLETGTMELEMHIKCRRVIYFHNLLHRKKHQLIYIFFMTQYYRRTSKDWVTQTLRDFEDLNIDASFQYLEKVSVLSFKRIVKTRIKEYSFGLLCYKKEKHSKLRKLK